MNPEQLMRWNAEKFKELHKEVSARASRVYQDMYRIHGVLMRCTRAYSSFEDQAALYAQGRTKPGRIVTWANAGDSYHQFKAAFDSCFNGTDPFLIELRRSDPAKAEHLWSGFGHFCEVHGLQWGGRWADEKRDMPHAQFTFGLTPKELKAIHKIAGIEGVMQRFHKVLSGEKA